MGILSKILGGDVGDLFAKIVGTFKLSPEKAAELAALKDSNATELAKLQLNLESKAEDALANEVSQAAAVIQAEAKSQSWLPRNVRPLLLLLWGSAITANILIPVLFPGHALLILDPWVYKLTAIGFTGYVAFRSSEKIFGTPDDRQNGK